MRTYNINNEDKSMFPYLGQVFWKCISALFTLVFFSIKNVQYPTPPSTLHTPLTFHNSLFPIKYLSKQSPSIVCIGQSQKVQIHFGQSKRQIFSYLKK